MISVEVLVVKTNMTGGLARSSLQLDWGANWPYRTLGSETWGVPEKSKYRSTGRFKDLNSGGQKPYLIVLNIGDVWHLGTSGCGSGEVVLRLRQGLLLAIGLVDPEGREPPPREGSGGRALPPRHPR